ASTRTLRYSTPGCYTDPATCLTKRCSTATRARSSISSIRRQTNLPGGSTITSRRFSRPKTKHILRPIIQAKSFSMLRGSRALNEVAISAEVQRRFQPILKHHRETLEAIRRKATFGDGVVQFDLVDEGYEGFNKFIPYYLFPEATYSVALTRGSHRTKISVG